MTTMTGAINNHLERNLDGSLMVTPENVRRLARLLSEKLASMGFQHVKTLPGESRPTVTKVGFVRAIVRRNPQFPGVVFHVAGEQLPYRTTLGDLAKPQVVEELASTLGLPVEVIRPQQGLMYHVALDGNPMTFLSLADREKVLREQNSPALPDEYQENLQAGIPQQYSFTDMVIDLADDETTGTLPPLTFCAGRGQQGPLLFNLHSIIHALIASTTGGGKSSFINAALSQLVANNGPDVLRLILADLKDGVEFSPYAEAGLPHLFPELGNKGTIETVDDLVQALDFLQEEMSRRNKLIKGNAKNIREYNALVERGEVPGPSIPVILMVVDEINAAILLESIKNATAMTKSQLIPRFAALATRARSAGIYFWAGAQDPNPKYLGDTFMAVMDTRIALNVRDWPTLTYCLDESTQQKLKNSGLPRGVGRAVIGTSALPTLTFFQVPYLRMQELNTILVGAAAWIPQQSGDTSTIATAMPSASNEGSSAESTAGVAATKAQPIPLPGVAASPVAPSWFGYIEADKETKYPRCLVEYILQRAFETNELGDNGERIVTPKKVDEWLSPMPLKVKEQYGLKTPKPGIGRTGALLRLLEQVGVLERLYEGGTTVPRMLAASLTTIDQAIALLEQPAPIKKDQQQQALTNKILQIAG